MHRLGFPSFVAATLAAALLPCACGSDDSQDGSSGEAARDGGSGSSGSDATVNEGGSSGGRDASASGDGAGGGGSDGGATADGGGTVTSSAGLHLFYTDLTSGPASGGANDKGVFVTLYGLGFGATQGTSTVTFGGGTAASCPVWSDTKVTCQLGAKAASGNVVIQVTGKGPSNGLPFTVRAGNVYFVTATGSDSAAGTFAAPWKTLVHAVQSIQPGDTIYGGVASGDSVSQTTEENYQAALSMDASDAANSGTAAAPKALLAFPGATVTIGAITGLERGLLTPDIGPRFDFWVIGGLTLRGATIALDFEGGADGWRVIGNDMSCPNGTGEAGCVNGGAASPTNLVFYGNTVHDAATTAASITKYYHGVYFGTNHLDLGWNTVRDGKTCRGIQLHDTDGPNEFDLHVHDNVVHGTICDGINFATVDPSQGVVEAYNNVVYDVGTGPDPADGTSDYACIYVAGETDTGADGQGNVEVYDNTLYNCGARGSSASAALINGGGTAGLFLHAVDNLVLQTGTETYLGGTVSGVTGSNELWFGVGAAPAGFAASVNADPLLVNAAGADFHLQAGSPATGTGIASGAATDIEGNPRGGDAGFAIGAYQYVP